MLNSNGTEPSVDQIKEKILTFLDNLILDQATNASKDKVLLFLDALK